MMEAAGGIFLLSWRQSKNTKCCYTVYILHLNVYMQSLLQKSYLPKDTEAIWTESVCLINLLNFSVSNWLLWITE